MRRGGLLLAWLLAGHAVAAGFYALLITLADANAFLLALSALSLLGGLTTWALTDATALAWLVPGTSFRDAWRCALRRGVPAFVLAAALLFLCWWVFGRAYDWYRAHTGQIDAWLMATFDTTRTQWVHRAAAALHYVLRNLVAVSLAASLMAAAVIGGLRAALSLRWVASGLSRFQLGLVTGAIVSLITVPWTFVDWRPDSLPATSIETVFVALKLSALVVLAHLAWALILFAAQQTYGSSRQPRPAASAPATHAAERS